MKQEMQSWRVENVVETTCSDDQRRAFEWVDPNREKHETDNLEGSEKKQIEGMAS